MVTKTVDIAVAVNCVMVAAEGESSFNRLPLEEKAIVMKAAGDLISQMVAGKAIQVAIQQQIDRMGKTP